MKYFFWALIASIGPKLISAQNIGIGVANPQKGKLEIAGALGNHTTVLTIGSDGTGISLQRNWPTIGLNQYRDASNVQRFIGNGHAGSIYLSSDDGSIVFSQFGQGTAGQLITTANAPFYINGFGSAFFMGSLSIAQDLVAQNVIRFTGTPKIVSNVTGLKNLLPVAYASIKSDGSKFRGTDNISSAYNQALGAYILSFAESGVEAILHITPDNQVPCFATYNRFSSGVFGVYIWDKDGVKIQSAFSVTVMQ